MSEDGQGGPRAGRRGRLRAAWERPGVRFGLVGALNATLNLLGLWALLDGLHVPWPVAVTVLFVLLNYVGYRLNKAITFRLGRQVVRPELGRYFAVMLATLGVNLALMALLVDGLHLPALLASAVVTVLLAVVNYLLHRDVTFHVAPGPSGDALHVLQVSAFFPAHGGGIEGVAGQLARQLGARGIALTWMAGGSPQERPAPSEAGAGVTIDQARGIDFIERRLGLPAPLWSPPSVRRLWRHVGACSLVHVHDYLYLPSLLAIAFARLRRRPVIITQHIGDIAFESRAARLVLHLLNRTLGRLCLGGAGQVAFVGRPVLETFDAFVRWRRPPRLVPNGVDHALYRPDSAGGAGEPAREGPLRALFVGRFVEKKGLRLLNGCLDLEGVQWTFVGRGPLAPAASTHPAHPVHLAGALAPAAVARAMQMAEVLVLPSKGEGFPLVVQEALACGTPVLVSAEVAAAFPQTDRQCVHAVDVDVDGPGGAEEALARLRAALERLRDAPQALRAARSRAVALAAQWSWERCADEYQALYREILR